MANAQPVATADKLVAAEPEEEAEEEGDEEEEEEDDDDEDFLVVCELCGGNGSQTWMVMCDHSRWCART